MSSFNFPPLFPLNTQYLGAYGVFYNERVGVIYIQESLFPGAKTERFRKHQLKEDLGAS